MLNEYRRQIVAIARSFLDDERIKNDDERLFVIGSESVIALEFILAVEDEFNVEIDDDMINPNFFADYDYIANCVAESN